jgi:hypothetical protein
MTYRLCLAPSQPCALAAGWPVPRCPWRIGVPQIDIGGRPPGPACGAAVAAAHSLQQPRCVGISLRACGGRRISVGVPLPFRGFENRNLPGKDGLGHPGWWNITPLQWPLFKMQQKISIRRPLRRPDPPQRGWSDCLPFLGVFVILDSGLEEFEGLSRSASARDPELLSALLVVRDEELFEL